MNRGETGGIGVHAQLLAVYFQGMGDGHLKGMHLYGSALCLVLPEIYVGVCCSQQMTSAQGSGDQQKQVSAGGYALRGCLVSGPLLVDNAYHRMTGLQEVGALSCS